LFKLYYNIKDGKLTRNKDFLKESINSIEDITKNRVKSFLIEPFKMGFLYFAILFSIILFVKLVNYLATEGSFFILNIYDVMISVIGFSLGYILEFTLQLRKRIRK
jgi:ABC-type protease/lipase transport system fused ATPase/permease subunit